MQEEGLGKKNEAQWPAQQSPHPDKIQASTQILALEKDREG